MLPVHMDQLVQDCLREMRVSASDQRLQVRVGRLPACLGDEALIKQVWLNLLANAVKYSSKRAIATIEVGACDGGREISYFVRDNGVGFDMKYSEKLFGVFQRLHRAEEFEGTGVGLATVHRIVQRHGGRIWADSKPQEGAVFYFSLKGAAI
jgi:light-regulated signal transduction histidine kinase (bacteriophytochrome)